MVEGFWGTIAKRLLFWSGWVFGTLGAVAGLAVSKEYAWIGIVMAFSGLIPLGTHSWWVHRRLEEVERKHLEEKKIQESSLQVETGRREDAERKLSEIPAEAMSRLALLVSEGVAQELLSFLRLQAERIGRMKSFQSALEKPLSVRSFQRLQGELYVLAKGPVDALVCARPEDPFLLIRQNEAGIEVPAARMVVHQPIKTGDDVITLRVVTPLGDDIHHLTELANHFTVEGMKGYSVILAIEIDKLPDIDFSSIASAIPYLTTDLLRNRGGK